MTTPIPPRNLPSELTPIVGREEELEQLSRILTNPDARLVTVTGIGGMGKTRLVVATARKLWRERPDLYMDGIVYVPLAGLDSINEIPTALVQALDTPMSGQDQPMAEVCSFLSDKSTLLILDNFEQLVEGADIFYQLMEASDGICLLVTSRVPVHLQVEWRFDLAGLSYPRQTDFDQETSSDSYEALQLFVQSARQVSPDFQLTEESRVHVLDLCRLVAGMPLAIKLAAGWLRSMPLENIVAQLSRSMEILASNARDLPARQQSVQAIFEYSWELLQPEEQRIAKALSVFRGGFTEDAAAEVAFVTPEMLAALIDQGLVQPAGVAGYEMHELSRQFAERKLNADYLEAPVAHRRHAVFYLDFVARQEQVLLGRAPTVAVAALQSEIDNIRQAWKWAVKEKDYRALEQTLEVLAIFYEITGLLAEAEQIFGDAAEQLDDWSQNDESSSLVCQLLVKKAAFSIDRGDLKEAQKAIEQASSLANALQNRWRRADVHFIRGYAYRYSGEYEKGIKELDEAIQIYRSLDMEYQLVKTLNILGESQARYQLHEASLASHHQALDLATGLNDARGEALTLSHIGHAYYYQEDYQQSLSYFMRALKLFERQNDLLARSRTTANIGFLHNRLGNEKQALDYTNQAIELFKQIGSRPEFTYDVLGDIALARGDYERARYYYEDALAYVKDSGQRLEEAQLLAMLGRLDIAMGRYDAAGRRFQLAMANATDLDNTKLMPIVSGDIGDLLWRQGQTDEALIHFDQAITGLRRVSGRYYLARFLVEKGALLYELGAMEEAQAAITEGLDMAETMGRKPTIFRAKILLAMIEYAQDRPAEAHDALEGLLSEAKSPSLQAAVHFALWETQGTPENGQTALELYRHLATSTPDVLYQDRLAELEAALLSGVG